MQGYQLTFFTQQDRTHQQQPLAQWLVEQARLLGLRGATLQGGLEGLGHDGVIHAINLFDASDQPVQVTFVLSVPESDRLLDHLKRQGVRVFYTRVAAEFGTLGGDVTAQH